MKKIILTLLLLFSFTLLGEAGEGEEKKEDIKFEDVEKAAKGNDPKSQFDLAIMYYGGNQVDPDSKAAYGWLERAAKGSDPKALFLIGYMNEWGISTKADPGTAASYYERAVYSGNTRLSYKMALLYYYTLKDPVKAYAWISVASRAGFESAESLKKQISRSLSSSQRKEGDLLSREISKKIPVK